MFQLLSLVMPAYNEERTLAEVVTKIRGLDLGIKKEIIIVDDGSKDRTAEIAKELADLPADRHGGVEVKFFKMPQNSGKSQAVRHGIMQTTGDLIVVQDADLEYDAQDLKLFVEAFQTGNYDLIYGNRFGKDNKVIYWQNWFGNRFLSFFSSLFTFPRSGIWTNDMEVCYKMVLGDVGREVGEKIVSRSIFGLEPEITARLAKYKLNGKPLRFFEIPISYHPRSIAEGKKMHAVRDGLKAIWEIVKFNL